MKSLLTNSAVIAIIIVSSISVWLAGNLGAFGINKIKDDVIGYNSYTSAVFIKKDISLKFYKDSSSWYNDRGMIWANRTTKGSPVMKPTYGLSLMYLPFTIWPVLFSDATTGYELPFSIAICVSSLVYFILSLIVLYKTLKLLKFNNNSIAFTIYCVSLGTNLFAYSGIVLGMPHVYDFFLLTCALYCTIKWHLNPKWKYASLLGVCFGLLVLIRPTNIFLTLAFFIYDFKSVKSTLILFQRYKLHILLMGLIAFIIIVPQLLYWKYITGHYFFNSYVGERFFFNDPKIIDFLFGFRKGWFIYTPLILIAFYGIYKLKKQNPFFLPTLFIVFILIYLNSSWWCWWFGGGYGARPMIETYPLLAIGFAAFYNQLFSYTKRKVAVTFTLFLILFNCKSVHLYRINAIHFDGMTFRAYLYTLFKIDATEEDKREIEKLIIRPDYKKALAGNDS